MNSRSEYHSFIMLGGIRNIIWFRLGATYSGIILSLQSSGKWRCLCPDWRLPAYKWRGRQEIINAESIISHGENSWWGAVIWIYRASCLCERSTFSYSIHWSRRSLRGRARWGGRNCTEKGILSRISWDGCLGYSFERYCTCLNLIMLGVEFELGILT